MKEKTKREPVSERRNPKWTVMVYLAGDNNLTANCITVLQQLEAVKYTDDISVLACFDSNTPWPKGSRYLAINGKRRMNNEDLDWEIYNDLIITEDREHEIDVPDFCSVKKDRVQGRQMGRTDVAEGLKRFLRWAMKQNRSSDHYMLVLYGHGPVVAGKTFLSRENPVSSLTMKDLPILLEPHFGKGRKLDILALQNCAMNGIETAYEVKDQVDYMVGSQGLVLSYGWPYDKIISALLNNPEDTPLQISQKILKECARHLIDFSVMDRSSEQSVCDLSKLRDGNNVKDAVAELSKELQAALTFKQVQNPEGSQDPVQIVLKYPVICDAVRLARLEAQSFWGETFVDLYDFCERLLKKCNEAILVHNDFVTNAAHDLITDLAQDPKTNVAVDAEKLEGHIRKTELVSGLIRIIGHCKNVMDQVRELVPYSFYIGSELQYSRGLSIYFPWSMQREPYSFFFRSSKKEHVLVTAFEIYSKYKFVEDSGWADFLRSFYGATLRKVRRAERTIKMRPPTDTLSFGLIKEYYRPVDNVVTTQFLQKTDSNTGAVDYDVWSNVKNYPRRDYISPSDCPRKTGEGGTRLPGVIPEFPNAFSPPVSYIGWNFSEFLADVIRKTPGNETNNGTEKKVTSRRKTAPKP